MRFGVSGVALVRAADAMLRALGGAEVTVISQQVVAGRHQRGVGVGGSRRGKVKFSPVVVAVRPQGKRGPQRRRSEFLLPASVVVSEAVDRNVASGVDLLNGALGLVHQGETLHIAGRSATSMPSRGRLICIGW